jgi:outer membrane protein OmpA-like peptidoglycan-associated protein
MLIPRNLRIKFKNHQKIPILLCLSLVHTSVVFANTVGSSFDNFNPTSSGLDYVTVRSSKVLNTGNFSLGLFMDHAFNTLPYFQDQNTRSDSSKKINDSITSMNFSVGYGLSDNWELGLNLPIEVTQQINEKDTYHGQFAKSGITAVSLSTKYNLWHKDNIGIAAVGTIDMNTVKDDPFNGLNSGANYSALLVADIKILSITLAGNLGYKYKTTGQALKAEDNSTPIQPIKNEILASTAIQYSIPNTKVDLVWEIYGNSPQNKDVMDLSPRNANILESIGGAKYHFDNGMIGHAGIGTEIIHSTNTPDFRAYAGVYWIIGNKEVKKPEPPPYTRPLPPPIPPITREPDEKITVQDVLFPFDKATISHSAAKKNLKKIGDLLHKKPLEVLVIDGHTCSIGTAQYNLKLSRHRANAIKDWIVKEYNIPASKIIIKAYGLTKPIASNRTNEGRKLNRRTEFKIYYVK